MVSIRNPGGCRISLLSRFSGDLGRLESPIMKRQPGRLRGGNRIVRRDCRELCHPKRSQARAIRCAGILLRRKRRVFRLSPPRLAATIDGRMVELERRRIQLCSGWRQAMSSRRECIKRKTLERRKRENLRTATYMKPCHSTIHNKALNDEITFETLGLAGRLCRARVAACRDFSSRCFLPTHVHDESFWRNRLHAQCGAPVALA